MRIQLPLLQRLSSDMARRLAKNVADGQNFRRLMETFMNDVQCDALPRFQVV